MKQDSTEPLVKATFVTKNSVRFYLVPEFGKAYTRKSLFLSYPEDIDLECLPLSVVQIPLITNVISTIWFSGKKYGIEEMDEDLFHSLKTIKQVFKRFFYNTAWDGELIPKRLVKNSIRKTDIQSATLFSGGLDSTTTVLRHIDEHPLLISFNEPHKTAVTFAKDYNLDFSIIHADFYDFLKLSKLDKVSIDITKWFWDTSMGLSWVGIAAPFLYAKGIPQLYIPSGFTWRSFLFPDGQTMLQPASPLIDENLSPMGLKVTHDVFTMTRTDKIEYISQFCAERKIPKPQLIVCTHHRRADTAYSNCLKCTKCVLTMLDIIAIGEDLDKYGFDSTEDEFVAQFKEYTGSLTMRRGGTYAALLDTQRYIAKNIDRLPKSRRAFYKWFLSIDLWAKVHESNTRPLRKAPFDWQEYKDLYPGVVEWVE